MIDPATYPILEKIAELVNSRTNRVRMEGHTDSVPIRTARYPSNWELSSARAIAMLRLLTDRFHVDHMRMSVTGYADTVPVAPNDTPEGRARNRRVDIVLLSEMGLRPIKGGGEPASDEPAPAAVGQAPSGAAEHAAPAVENGAGERAAPAAEHRAAIAEPVPNAAETSPTAAASPANAAEPAKSAR